MYHRINSWSCSSLYMVTREQSTLLFSQSASSTTFINCYHFKTDNESRYKVSFLNRYQDCSLFFAATLIFSNQILQTMAKFWRLIQVKIRAVVPQNDQDHRESWTGACQYYYHQDVPPSDQNDHPSDSQQFRLMAKIFCKLKILSALNIVRDKKYLGFR